MLSYPASHTRTQKYLPYCLDHSAILSSGFSGGIYRRWPIIGSAGGPGGRGNLDLCARCLNQRMMQVITINHKIVPMLGQEGFWDCSGRWGAGKTLRHGSINMITSIFGRLYDHPWLLLWTLWLENSKRKSSPMIKPSQLGEKDIVSSEMAIDKFRRVSSLHGTILLEY